MLCMTPTPINVITIVISTFIIEFKPLIDNIVKAINANNAIIKNGLNVLAIVQVLAGKFK